MNETAIIDRRFRGPATSGNGGYTAGLVARLVGGVAESTLRRPPPLDRPLEIRREGGRVLAFDGEDLVAESVAAVVDLAIPEPPSPAEAAWAAEGYAGFRHHHFPECFVCGPDRAVGDGLRVFPGWVEGRNLVAAPCRADESLPAEAGHVATEIAWSFLDCPGAWAMDRAQQEGPVVLGRMAARLVRPIPIGAECIAIGWPLGREGRKLHSATALFDVEGGLYGVGRQTWIVII